eukprot:CAMPEP_0197177794 /NCGR_PEP_ID=MMETSP1423-20130617/3274_1 /TAXON_ID=476441 /ORGANISM="Pseudo-nitzschia heimii, Strain UNC1101" /LENGTH=514 /DNA_ID=CAMNT_0042627401 /DNA_START=56 /DNA_END=1600 /DNA_ORIENTATION=-
MTTSLSKDITGPNGNTIENDDGGNEQGSPDVLIPEQLQHPPETILNTIMGVMGNVLEWYDFALFGYFSDVIAKVFFPPTLDEAQQDDNLVKSFVIFGSAFLMRPIGGLLIGYVGDKHGRKEALTRSLFLMAIPTTLMGCLPTYRQVGVLSTILLCLCRLVQGISVGGQLPASLVYTVEKRPRAQWGYYGSLPMVAAGFGTLLGNLCGAFMREIMSEEQLEAWGWRLPFFSGIVISGVAVYLRKYGVDTDYGAGLTSGEDDEAEDDAAPKPEHNPIRVAFRKGNRLALLSTSITPMLWGSGFYVSFVWVAIFMEELMDPPVPHAFWINSMGLLFGMLWVMPIAGSISDRVGRTFVMTISGVLLTLMGPICLVLISKGNVAVAFASQLILGLLLSFYGGPLCAWLVENFSPEVRMTSASIGYDISHAIAGGFSPAIATVLYTNYGLTAASMVYVIFGSLSVMGIYINYFCGGNDKEADTGAKNNNNGGSVEMQGNGVVTAIDDGEAATTKDTPELV